MRNSSPCGCVTVTLVGGLASVVASSIAEAGRLREERGGVVAVGVAVVVDFCGITSS